MRGFQILIPSPPAYHTTGGTLSLWESEGMK